MAQVHRIKCGNGNCYIIEGKEGSILVDTARPKYREYILKECKEKKVKLIVLTHTHMDHFQNAQYISKELNIPVAISKSDEELIESNMRQTLSAKTILGKIVLAVSLKSFNYDEIPEFKPEIYLQEGDTLENYGVDASIIELPGHTNGSIGIDIEGDGIIVGDALMNMFYPTVSMLYHDYNQMLESAKRIQDLGDKIIYFGHGKPVRNKIWVKLLLLLKLNFYYTYSII